eukprot:scaffold2082_cov111-Isochrysis_galbana.AAC.4
MCPIVFRACPGRVAFLTLPCTTTLRPTLAAPPKPEPATPTAAQSRAPESSAMMRSRWRKRLTMSR